MKKNYFGKDSRNILLFLVFPTPNGRLHLGHIGGPYLKLDVIKRFNKQIGNEAYIYGGTDSYDSYVLLKAIQENKTPDEVCNYYHQAIEDDIRKACIDIDYFFNPVNNKELYFNTVSAVNAPLLSKNKAELISELYPHSANIGFLPPSFITGSCPYCSETIHSFMCEKCGSYFKPEQVKDITCKATSNEIQLNPIQSLFLPINKNKVLSNFKNSTLPKNVLDVLHAAVEQSDLARLSLPIAWGAKANSSAVFYTYSNFFAYLYTLGEIFKNSERQPCNPFDTNSTVETVGSFGFDNIISFMVNTLNHANTLEYPGLTHYLPNHFFTLNGKKFSTSRNHAIWVSKIKATLSIDIFRLYMLKANADKKENDFNVVEFVDFYNDIAGQLNNRLFRYFDNKSNHVPDLSYMEVKFRDPLNANYEASMPENYCGYTIYTNIKQFLSVEIQDIASYLLWLKGFAILSYSVMPNLAQLIWNAMSINGTPDPEKLLINCENFNHNLINKFDMIKQEDIILG